MSKTWRLKITKGEETIFTSYSFKNRETLKQFIDINWPSHWTSIHITQEDDGKEE